MHNPLSGISWCSVAVLPVSLVPLICTPPVGGKAPPVPLGVSLCSPWEPQGVVPARWCCARARACLSAVRLLVSCVAGHFGGVSVSRCWVWWLGWLGSFGLFCSVGTLRPTWRVGLGVTHPCLLAGGSVRPRVVSLWPLACPGQGCGGQEYRAVLQPPSLSSTLLTVCGECAPRTIPIGYTCRNVARLSRSTPRRKCALVPAVHLSPDARPGR